MKCLTCGAEMRLIDVRIEATTPFAIERRIFQCSSCRQTAQRLGFDRSGLPDCTAPAVKGYASAIRLQADRSAAGGAPGHAGEKLISREVAVTLQKSVDWGAVVGKVSIALKEQAVGSKGRCVGEDGRKAPQQTDGAQGASSPCQDH